MTHTPGPWHVESDFIAYSISGPPKAAGYNGCFAKEADARLISASPDLLNTLRYIRDECTGLPAHARALADLAIKKAEGP
jgi:hypothetical protein